MYKFLLLFASYLILLTSPAAGEIAFIPYKIDNPSTYFNEKDGIEYARLLAAASIIKKENIVVTSPRDLLLDLKQHRISTRGLITSETLQLLGSTRHINYFLLGSLTRNDGKYYSKSVLYSVRDKRVVLKVSVSAENLIALAVKEINEALVRYSDKKEASGKKGQMDALFIVDTSYRMRDDFTSVKKAIENFSRSLIDKYRVNSRIYIVPFSKRDTYSKTVVSQNSILSVRKGLDSLHPAGTATSDHFVKSLEYAVKSIRWRKNSKKLITIIYNSKFTGSTMAEKYAIMARRKGIHIYSLSLGRIKGDDSERVARLSGISNGRHFNVSYYQKLFNARANAVDLYYENGRLFQSQFYRKDWKQGLFLKNKEYGSFEKPRGFLNEIFFDEKKYSLTPYTLQENYQKIKADTIINSRKLRNNCDEILEKIMSSFVKMSSQDSVLGKALITDGSISFWIYMTARDYRFFKSKEKSGIFFPLGCSIKKDVKAPHGISLVPEITGLTEDYIPQILKVSLADAVKRSDYYMTRGLFYPPIWFFSVKVTRIVTYKSGTDVRDF